MMVKVMLVDDNMLIRQSIYQTIPWDSIGCEVIGEAANGEEALNLAKDCSPDLIITDIRMPQVDGLELTERIRSQNPWCKVIIITGYDEFSYAQRAIKLGAFDLILKPIDNEELKTVVVRAVKEFQKELREQNEKREMLEERKSMQNVISRSTLELRVKYIIDILNGLSLKEEAAKEKIRYFDLAFSKHALFIIQPCIADVKKGGGQQDAVCAFAEYSERAVERAVKLYKGTCIPFWFDNAYTVIAIPSKADTDKNAYSKIMEVCGQIAESLQKSTGVKFTIGVSNLCNGIADIKKSFDQAKLALNCKFFIDNKIVISAGALISKSILNESPIMRKISMFYEYIKNEEYDYESLLDEIFNEIRENETTDAGFVKSLLIDICITVKRIMYEKKKDLQKLKDSCEIHADISSLTNISEAFSYVKEFISEILNAANTDSRNSYSQITKKVLDYLNKNYYRKISLQEIADVVALSPAYISRIIKKETGESYVDLFNNIKINIALKLLKNTNLKAYEVANKVGIENYAYFYQLFKKVTGTSPSEYNNS